MDASADGRLHARIRTVISDRSTAPGLQRAREGKLDTVTVERGTYPDSETFENDLAMSIESAQPDLVVLAGFMRVLRPEFVNRFAGQMINIHPSLLPRHKGLETHRRALEAGDAEHGASVHFVTPNLDGGPVLAQIRMPVRADDTPQSLADRLLPLEHQLLVDSVALFAQQRVQCRDEQILLDNQILGRPVEPGHGLPGRAGHGG